MIKSDSQELAWYSELKHLNDFMKTGNHKKREHGEV